VLPFDQVRARLLDPGRIDARHVAGIDFRGLDLFGADHPGRPRLELARSRVDENPGAIGAEVFTLLLAQRHLRQQTREQRAVDGRVLGRLAVRLERELALHHLHDLAVHVVPFGEA
jgi:hypothetical protein